MVSVGNMFHARFRLMVDGVAAVLSYSPSSRQKQLVCIPDWRGVQVLVILTAGMTRRHRTRPDPTACWPTRATCIRSVPTQRIGQLSRCDRSRRAGPAGYQY
jgi:hypothetical protein